MGNYKCTDMPRPTRLDGPHRRCANDRRSPRTGGPSEIADVRGAGRDMDPVAPCRRTWTIFAAPAGLAEWTLMTPMSNRRSSKTARSNTSTTGHIVSSSPRSWSSHNSSSRRSRYPIEEFDPSRARTGYLRTAAVHEGTEIVNQHDSGLGGIHAKMMPGVAVIRRPVAAIRSSRCVTGPPGLHIRTSRIEDVEVHRGRRR